MNRPKQIYESKEFDDLGHLPLGVVKSKAKMWADGEVQIGNDDDGWVGVSVDLLREIVSAWDQKGGDDICGKCNGKIECEGCTYRCEDCGTIDPNRGDKLCSVCGAKQIR